MFMSYQTNPEQLPFRIYRKDFMQDYPTCIGIGLVVSQGETRETDLLEIYTYADKQDEDYITQVIIPRITMYGERPICYACVDNISYYEEREEFDFLWNIGRK